MALRVLEVVGLQAVDEFHHFAMALIASLSPPEVLHHFGDVQLGELGSVRPAGTVSLLVHLAQDSPGSRMDAMARHAPL